MELEEICACVAQGAYWVTDHAITEGFKDGITVADMVRAMETGKIVERYPERHRCLVFGRNDHGLPIHVVVDFRTKGSVDIITAYVPQRDQWIRDQIRKRKRR